MHAVDAMSAVERPPRWRGAPGHTACSCGGCTNCRQRAWLQRVVREGRWLRASRSGRYDVFGWPALAPRVEVLVDPQAPGRFVAARRAEEVEDEMSGRPKGRAYHRVLERILPRKRPAPRGGLLQRVLQRDASMGSPDSLGKLLADHAPTADEAIKRRLRNDTKLAGIKLCRVALGKASTVPGLYLLQWDDRAGNKGQYFGQAGNLNQRLLAHWSAMRRYGLVPGGRLQVKMFTASKECGDLDKAKEPRGAEHAALKAIDSILGRPRSGHVPNFVPKLGLTNRALEIELPQTLFA